MTLTCRNPRCGEPLRTWSRIGLCPSCRYMGRWGMFLGGVLAGAIAWWLR
jgi:hypothetical protein